MTQRVRQSLEWLLECAVILSWADLLLSHKSGSIHVEYTFSPEGTISTLKLWLSTARGHWRLVYGLRTERNTSIQFEGWCRSADLASNLEFVLRHQTAFLPLQNYGRAGLQQIKSPSQDEIDTAAAAMRTARSYVDSISGQPATAVGL